MAMAVCVPYNCTRFMLVGPATFPKRLVGVAVVNGAGAADFTHPVRTIPTTSVKAIHPYNFLDISSSLKKDAFSSYHI
jgi:hypothetical protein